MRELCSRTKRPLKFKIFYCCAAAGCILLLGLIYPCLAALHACVPGAFCSTWAHNCQSRLWRLVWQAQHWTKGEEREVLGFGVRLILTVPLMFNCWTVGLSVGGLVCLRDCACGECCQNMPMHGALAMLLSGQVTNFLVADLCYLAAARLECSKAVQSLWDFWSTKNAAEFAVSVMLLCLHNDRAST